MPAPEPTVEEFVSRLSTERRERLYKLLDMQPDLEEIVPNLKRWSPTLEKIVDFSHAKAIFYDVAIKVGGFLGVVLAAVAVFGIFKSGRP